jgi:hypothetical protein
VASGTYKSGGQAIASSFHSRPILLLTGLFLIFIMPYPLEYVGRNSYGVAETNNLTALEDSSGFDDHEYLCDTFGSPSRLTNKNKVHTTSYSGTRYANYFQADHARQWALISRDIQKPMNTDVQINIRNHEVDQRTIRDLTMGRISNSFPEYLAANEWE